MKRSLNTIREILIDRLTPPFTAFEQAHYKLTLEMTDI